MNLRMLGAASVMAIAIVACAKEAETTVAETEATPETAAAAPADDEATLAAAPADDVYGATAEVDIDSVRTKDALTEMANAAFADADTDQDGSLTQPEFYVLAAMLEPETAVDATADAGVGMTEDAADAMGEGDAEDAMTDEATGDDGADLASVEPMTDDSSLDASYATIAGGDASLTVEDLRTALLSRFDAADANLDGMLDDAEAASFQSASLF